MKSNAGVFQALAVGLAILVAIVIAPFIWLYEQVGGMFFFIIAFGIPAALWFIARKWKGDGSAPLFETDEQRKGRKRYEAEEFHAHNRQIIEQREQERQREHFLKKHQEKAERRGQANCRPIHINDHEGEISIDWRRQFEEISRVWREGDYDQARDWLQKLAYRLKSEEAPEAVHTKFKALMAEFTRDDPLYAEVMRFALPVITEQSGIIQSQLSKQLHQFNAEHFRYAMYYGAVIGDVVRVKKGRSYALTLPVSSSKRPPAESMKRMGTYAIQARRRDCWGGRRDQMRPLTHLRPFWQLVGPCAGDGDARKTLLASDPFWSGSNVPWNCKSDDCECQVYSLSRIELKRYIEAGCGPGDEAAAELLRTFDAQS